MGQRSRGDRTTIAPPTPEPPRNGRRREARPQALAQKHSRAAPEGSAAPRAPAPLSDGLGNTIPTPLPSRMGRLGLSARGRSIPRIAVVFSFAIAAPAGGSDKRRAGHETTSMQPIRVIM